MSDDRMDPESRIEGIEAEIARHPMLTDKQISDVRMLCERFSALCRSGRYLEARMTKAHCMSVIAQGAPVPE